MNPLGGTNIGVQGSSWERGTDASIVRGGVEEMKNNLRCQWRTGREEGGRGRCGGRGEGQRAPVCLDPSLSLRLEGERHS